MIVKCRLLFCKKMCTFLRCYIIFLEWEQFAFSADFSNRTSIVLLGQVAQLRPFLHMASVALCWSHVGFRADALFNLVAHSRAEETNGGDFSGLFAQYSVNIRRMFPIRFPNGFYNIFLIQRQTNCEFASDYLRKSSEN